MPKNRTQIKVVDYRSVNLAWLVDFKDKVFSKELAPEIELVVAQEDVSTGSNFQVHKGDTLCVTGETATVYTTSRPYGDVRTGEIAKTAVEPKPRYVWSTEDVAEYVIKRACMKDQCTYLEMIEKPEKNVSKKNYKGTFVSQARRCRFADLVGSLEYFYTLKMADIVEQYVWLDIFSANQPKLTARNVEPAVRKENERQLTEGLHISIANFEQRVMFMDKWDGTAPLKRAWCVWEIFGVAKAKKPLEIALPESEYDRFIVTLKEDYDSIITKTSAVDVEKAQCFNPADLKAIHKAIREESSFQTLDDIVKTQLRLWVASTGKLQVEKEEQKECPVLKEISLLANQAGRTYHDQGDFRNAEPLLRKALRVAEENSEDRKSDSDVARALCNLASMLEDKGKLVEAESLYHQALEMDKKAYGDDNPAVAVVLNNLALLLQAQDEYAEAEKMQREALRIDLKFYGGEHPVVARDLNNIALFLSDQRKNEEALPLCQRALKTAESVHGEIHPLTAECVINKARCLSRMEQYMESTPCFNRALKIRLHLVGEMHPEVAKIRWWFAEALKAQGHERESRQQWQQALEIYRAKNLMTHPNYKKCLALWE